MSRAPTKRAPKKRGPKGARGRPVNPARVRKIVRMREDGMTFYAIASILSKEYPITEQAINTAYLRWRDWVIENPK